MTSRVLMVAGLAGILWAQSPAVKLPSFSKKTLANGSTLILLEKPDVPMVTVRAVFRGGGEAVVPAKAGLAPLTTELLRRGTASYTADQINERLDSLGAQLQASADASSTTVSMEYLKRNQDASLALFEEILLKPTFPEAEFVKARAQSVDRAKAAKDNPGQAIRLYWDPFFYPAGHPYKAPLSGDEITLASITREDVVGFHAKTFTGANLIFIVAGDLNAQQVAARFEKLAAAVPGGVKHKDATAIAVKFDSPRLLLIDKPDSTQTYFNIGVPGLSRTDPDRVAVSVVNTLFGGRFTSMLNDELRVNSGLTYGARSSVEQERLPGSIVISTYTRVDKTVEAMDLALAVLARLREHGISAEQLASAKNYIKGNFPTDRLETADQLASVIGELELNGLGKGEIDDLFSKIDALTVEQVNAAARKWYKQENLQFLLVGPAGKIADQVKKYSPKMKVQPVKEPGFKTPEF